MFRRGTRVAIDVGTRRIGLAKSDPEGIMASPLETLEVNDEVIEKLLLCVPTETTEIYVGLPLNLQGSETLSTHRAVAFAKELSQKISIPIRFIDERLTTSLAQTQLREVGKSQKEARNTIDQMAAVAILESGLNIEKSSGSAPGIALEDWILDND